VFSLAGGVKHQLFGFDTVLTFFVLDRILKVYVRFCETRIWVFTFENRFQVTEMAIKRIVKIVQKCTEIHFRVKNTEHVHVRIEHISKTYTLNTVYLQMFRVSQKTHGF
jgi:hypothetical protein